LALGLEFISLKDQQYSTIPRRNIPNLGDLGSDRNGVAVAGPHREGEEPKPMMNGPEKSDPVIVAMKPEASSRPEEG
jgi:hypothetical protein